MDGIIGATNQTGIGGSHPMLNLRKQAVSPEVHSTQEISYREIPLTKGYVAIVDEADYERISRYKWCASHSHGDVWYAKRFVNRHTSVYMHREILGVGSDVVSVDHINRNGLDNRRCNLRPCTVAENSAHKKMNTRTKAPYRGIKLNNGMWHASIVSNKQFHFLGSYADPVNAALAYDAAARRYHGQFAVCNFNNVA